MNNTENTKISKSLLIAAGVITFVVGLIVAAAFSNVFDSRLVPFAVFVGFIAFVIYKFKSGNCCGK